MDDPEKAVSEAAKSAKRSASVALMCILVLLLVLVIDNQIKRALIAKVAEARQIIDMFTVQARRWDGGGAEPPGDPDPGADHADGEPDSGVGGAAAGREMWVRLRAAHLSRRA